MVRELEMKAQMGFERNDLRYSNNEEDLLGVVIRRATSEREVQSRALWAIIFMHCLISEESSVVTDGVRDCPRSGDHR